MNKSIVDFKNQIVTWLRNEFEKNGRNTAVVGASGGKDSSTILALCAKALGRSN